MSPPPDLFADLPTSSAEEAPAKTCPLPDDALASLVSAAACSGTSFASWMMSAPLGCCLRTCRVYSLPTADEISQPSFEPLPSSGMAWPGGCLTHNSSEWPSDAAVSSLSDVLEAPQNVPPKYYLSSRACAGILRRAERRGRELPQSLKLALEQVAAQQTPERESA